MQNSHIFSRISMGTKVIHFCLLAVLLFSCQHEKGSPERAQAGHPEYARGFSLANFEGYTRLQVFDPWQSAEGIQYTYYLTDDVIALPDSLPTGQIIQTPVQRMVCMSTTHVAMVNALGEGEKICGMSGAQYIYDSLIQAQYQAGKLRDVGYGNNLNYELLVKLKPDLVLLYGVGSEVLTLVEKLQDLQIPAMLIGEYLEEHPLGKTEWIQVYGELLDRRAVANRLYTEVKDRYISLKDSIHDHKQVEPVVMSGLPFKDVWYVSPVNTYASRLIQDAGGEYLWEDKAGREAIPLSLEAVYARAVRAEVWINTGTAMSLPEIKALDERLAKLPPVQLHRVYNNNQRVNPLGGNDYWESGIMHPHWILEDLIQLFHSSATERTALHYYKPIAY